VEEIMKSQALKFVVLAFLVGIFSLSIVAQDQPSNVDKLTQREAKARVQSAMTNKQVKALIVSAKTPEDHMRLAAYFDQEADRMEADAKGHEELAGVYRQSPNTFVPKGVDQGSSGQPSTATPPQNRSGKRPRA
jgi:hypothetical protein